MWEIIKVQTFFRGRNLKWFEVESRLQKAPMSDTIEGSLKSILKLARQKDKEKLKTNIISMVTNRRTESSPWLRRTGWIELLEGKDMTVLCNYTLNEERDSEENAIIASVKRVIERCISGVRDLEKRGWSKVRFWLQSLAVFQSGYPRIPRVIIWLT